MSAPPPARGEPNTGRRHLVAYLEAGCKPASAWKIGTEHEKFAFRLSDLRPLPYEGPDGIQALLSGLTRFGWKPVYEGENIIALEGHKDGNVSLEPGGQVELSGAPLETLHDTRAEIQEHLQQVKSIGNELGIGMIGLGFQPKWTREQTPWMPKGRYEIMKNYMPKRGKLGIDMMLRTCTVQVNLDYSSESDMIRKFRIGLALQPIATALFANSPFTEGKPNGFQSFRSHIWTDTDPDRCGDLPFVFEDGFGFDRYVDYALGVPMYFVYRDGKYIDASGQSFRDFLAGKLPALPGETPLITDWVNHLTTLFPEVRLKRYLEMRGADGGPWRRLLALPAFWTGLLYDDQALSAAWDLVKEWTDEDRAKLRRDVPRVGLKSWLRGRLLREVALEVLSIARAGLDRRNRINALGENEAHYIDTLFAIAGSTEAPAADMLRRYHGPWQGSVEPVFREYAY
ncbi:Glutamate--cysteine ligase [Azospirillaceae bacterium]